MVFPQEPQERGRESKRTTKGHIEKFRTYLS